MRCDAASLPAEPHRASAGMTYLKYSSLCAEVVRGALKEPFLTKVRAGWGLRRAPLALKPPAGEAARDGVLQGRAVRGRQAGEAWCVPVPVGLRRML